VVTVALDCHQPAKTGSVAVEGAINICPVVDGLSANPADAAVGLPLALAITAHDPDSGPAPRSYRHLRAEHAAVPGSLVIAAAPTTGPRAQSLR